MYIITKVTILLALQHQVSSPNRTATVGDVVHVCMLIVIQTQHGQKEL